MKHILAVLLLAVPFCLNPALAATAQQTKMGTCNKEATGKKGDERKAFMKQCLSAKPAAEATAAAAPAAVAPAAAATQQSKMKSCNADATGKKGDERKAFMKECLKKAA